jgi:hypothetical protein
MLCSVCISKALIRANFWYLKFSYRTISFDVIKVWCPIPLLQNLILHLPNPIPHLRNPIPRLRNLIPRLLNDVNWPLILCILRIWRGTPSLGWGILQLGKPSFSPLGLEIIILILPCVTKLHDIWVMLLIQNIPYGLFYKFLYVQ